MRGTVIRPRRLIVSSACEDDSTRVWSLVRPGFEEPSALMCALPCWLGVGADDLEVLVDEDVVRPVDADVVDLVLAAAQLHNTVDNAPWVRGQRSFSRLIRRRSTD